MGGPSRRQFLAYSGTVSSGIVLGATGAVSAGNGVTFQRTFVDYRGNPIEGAQINLGYYDDRVGEYRRKDIYTDEDGGIETTVSGEADVRMGFYKSDGRTTFLDDRLDGVPHIYTFDDIRVARQGTDRDEIQLPEAYTLEARAVLGKRRGVEDAIPRFGSIDDRSYYASGYSFTTTDVNGYMKLIGADFTGVEMAGATRIWMYPPTFEPYEDQEQHDYAPYEKVSIRNVDVTDDTTVEIDISRRKDNNGGDG